MANVLDQELSGYLVQLNDAEKKSILLMLKTFLQRRSFPENPISIEQYNQEVYEAFVTP